MSFRTREKMWKVHLFGYNFTFYVNISSALLFKKNNEITVCLNVVFLEHNLLWSLEDKVEGERERGGLSIAVLRQNVSANCGSHRQCSVSSPQSGKTVECAPWLRKGHGKGHHIPVVFLEP